VRRIQRVRTIEVVDAESKARHHATDSSTVLEDPSPHARTIPAVSTISVCRCTLRKRIVLCIVDSMVGSYDLVNDPETNALVRFVFPEARNPSTATLRDTTVGSFMMLAGGVLLWRSKDENGNPGR